MARGGPQHWAMPTCPSHGLKPPRASPHSTSPPTQMRDSTTHQTRNQATAGPRHMLGRSGFFQSHHMLSDRQCRDIFLLSQARKHTSETVKKTRKQPSDCNSQGQGWAAAGLSHHILPSGRFIDSATPFYIHTNERQYSQPTATGKARRWRPYTAMIPQLSHAQRRPHQRQSFLPFSFHDHTNTNERQYTKPVTLRYATAKANGGPQQSHHSYPMPSNHQNQRQCYPSVNPPRQARESTPITQLSRMQQLIARQMMGHST
jgi:hypothetical protein